MAPPVSVYPSGDLGRVELDAQDGAVLAGAPGGLRGVQGPGEGEAVGTGNPDQRAFLGLAIVIRAGCRGAQLGRDRSQDFGPGREADRTDEVRYRGGRAGDSRHPHRGREAELGSFG